MKPKFVDVNGINTRYFEKGRGEPLVLVHGGQYGSYYSAYSWSLNIEGLSRSFHLYAFDRLGMGYTDNPKTDEEYTMTATLKHTHDFLVALGIKEASLIGHSRGAFVIARLALDYPDLAKCLVIIDSQTLAPDDPSTPKNFYEDLEMKAPEVETRESVQLEPTANSYSRNHITKDFVEELYNVASLPKTIQARQKMKTTAGNLFLNDLNKKRQETLEMINAGRLKVPALILWGLNDPSAPLKLGLNLFQIISSQIPRSQLHIFNQAGHYSFREHPEDFNRVVTNFINLS